MSTPPDVYSINRDSLIDTKTAAAMLGVTPHCMEVWRLQGGRGPRFHRIGRIIRYRRSTLEKFIAASERTSTSDPGKPDESANPHTCQSCSCTK